MAAGAVGISGAAHRQTLHHRWLAWAGWPYRDMRQRLFVQRLTMGHRAHHPAGAYFRDSHASVSGLKKSAARITSARQLAKA